MEPAAHWEQVYGARVATEVSWYEREPATSVRLIEGLASSRSAAVVDIGAGKSILVDRLADAGFTDLTVLDVSRAALDEVRDRLGPRASRVTFACHDVLTWTAIQDYDIWHDRAAFHFLTTPEDRDHYVDLAERSVKGGGALVVGVFSHDGPTQCSGLPVCRYTSEDLADVFARSFTLVHHEREEHRTPSGAVQPFTWVVLRRELAGTEEDRQAQ